MNNTTSRVNQPNGLMPLIDPWPMDEKHRLQKPPQIPDYLEEVYWWAYIRPNAVAFFERQWIVNLILWGNFIKLRDKALDELGASISGKTLQIACVYGNFSEKLTQRITNGGVLDIVDILPIQLENIRRKLSPLAPVRVFHSDSTALKFADATYDQAVMFFLLHEMPEQVRMDTLREALRVVKPGGKLVIVDYHKPSAFNPLRYLFPIVYRLLEPFALDIWRQSIEEWLPQGFVPAKLTKDTYFGGLYQKIVIQL
jgi:ubiquinone/menaquinone biosynthesis C-methylase UbiE